MPHILPALAAAGVAALSGVFLTPAASSASQADPAPCTLLAAKSGILASSLPDRIKRDAAGRDGSGIDRLICRDLTYDGRKDMVASVASGRPIGVEAWVFFRGVVSGWKLAFHRIDLVKASVALSGTAVLETDPVYRVGDKRPCCPTGGMKHLRFEWQRGKMITVRVWHTQGP
jgi:hypothetical protein